MYLLFYQPLLFVIQMNSETDHNNQPQERMTNWVHISLGKKV